MTVKKMLLNVFGTLLILIVIAACGFQLRGDYSFPFNRLYLSGNVDASVKARLARLLSGSSSAKIVQLADEADATLHLDMVEQRNTLSLSKSGTAREFVLTTTLNYSLILKKREPIIQRGTISVNRFMAYSDLYALAKEAEAEILYRDMRIDLIDQLLRRLGAAGNLARKPESIDATPKRLPLPLPPP